MKLAKIIPVYKKDDHQQLGNYKPISVLSNLSKIYERVIYNRLYKFLERYDLFDKQQFGLRPKHTTIDANTELIKDVLNSLRINNKEYTIVVFMTYQRHLTQFLMKLCSINQTNMVFVETH